MVDSLRLYIYKYIFEEGSLWPWSYGTWISDNYLCNQCLSPMMMWVRISIRTKCTTLFDKVCQWLATSRWFSPGTPVSSTNKTDHHDITEILLKVMLDIIKQTYIWYRIHVFLYRWINIHNYSIELHYNKVNHAFKLKKSIVCT